MRPLARAALATLIVVLAAAPVAAWAQAAAAASNRPLAELVEAARAAARADRNRESADLFGEAIRRSPERRGELLQEYADQLTYSGRSAQAIPLYQEGLRQSPSAGQELRLLKGLGLALLWTDQPTLARPVFERLVRAQPADQDASRNLGRALSWSGRQRAAADHLEQHLRTHPADQEARLLLAQAQAWMGRSDRAAQTLASVPADHPPARRMAEELRRGSAPRSTVDAQRSTQSDQLSIAIGRVGHAIALEDGRGMLGLRGERLRYEREDGGASADVRRPVVHARYRFSDALELNGELGQERIRPSTGERHDRVVYATWLTFWPNDLWRFDLSANRATFDNLRSLRQGLTARQQGVSADFTPSERERYTVRLERGDYSDGNDRRWAQLEGEYRWRNQPQLWAGLRHTRFVFAHQLDNGYFNPKRFESTLLTLRTAWRPGGDEGAWELAAQAAAGREHADPDGSKPAYDLSLRAGWRLDRQTRLEARAQRFSSRTASSGFARTIVGLGLERAW